MITKCIYNCVRVARDDLFPIKPCEEVAVLIDANKGE